MGYIYKITNIIDNKVYVGQSTAPRTRWSRHKSDARLNKNGAHLYRAMRKFGIDNFEFEIIAQAESVEDTDRLEIEYIKQFNSSDREFGYNIHEGGQGIRIISEETRKKISKLKKDNTYRLGSKTSDETKKLLSDANKGNRYRLGVKVSDDTKELLRKINIGKIASEETLKRMSDSMKDKNAGSANGMFGKRSDHAKLTQEQADCIRTEYATGLISMLKLARKFGVSKRTILNIIHGKIYRRI